MNIKKVIITAAGLDTRLLPMSKELPKETLPIYIKSIKKPYFKTYATNNL
jgi:UTP-glucose-1-phosphate uridylyltransferase